VRVAYGLPAITTDATNGFDQVTSNVAVQQLLETAYTGPTRATFLQNGKTAGDINPFVAGLAEDHVPGSDLGPTFQAILVNQFSRLETGDQYFYLNESFTSQEQAILNQGATLGQVIKANTNITNLQSDVFINTELTTQNGLSKGFYTTRSGEVALTGTRSGTTLTTSLYNSLVTALANPNLPGYLTLVDANGNYLPDSFLQSFANVKSFLANDSPTNMAYALSVQLLTAEINVTLLNINPTTNILVPAVTFSGQNLSATLQNSLVSNGVSTASGVANIQNILNASIAELLKAPSTLSGAPDRAFQEALKDCLNGVNTNEDIFIV
jgi:hypothetical protein